MKLKAFKEKRQKKIFIFTMSGILFIASVFFYQSLALFTEKKNLNMINGHVEESRDLHFAYYVDDVITYDMPNKDSGYTLDNKSSCTNGVTISWNDNTWSASVNYQNYQSNTNSRAKCNLYFKKKLLPKEYILSKASTDEIIKDDGTSDHNLRYVGANPNNYIDIGDRDIDGNIIPWRIIGVMNNVDDGKGNKETRLKVIRSEGIGNYSWNTSDSLINEGWGANEWSESAVMKLLNPGYTGVGGSLYWNKTNGTCYNGQNNETTTCDFRASGLTDNAKKMIEEAVWHTGSNGTEATYNNILTVKFYELERSSNSSKICTSGEYCNDTVNRTTTWTGMIGLMHPSDYGYATSGGNTTNRATCLNTVLFSWDGTSVSECKVNNWLYKSEISQWTIIPRSYSTDAGTVFLLYSGGRLGSDRACNTYALSPVTYLKSSVKIIFRDGSESNPFALAEN